MLMILKTTVGIFLWPLWTALAVAKAAVLLPASGVLAALTALADKAVRSSVQDPSELIDGRAYVFRHRCGTEVRRTFYRSRSAAVSCPGDSFILTGLAEFEESIKLGPKTQDLPGVQCFQKRLPSGEATEASAWINMDCLFGGGPLRDTELRAA